MILDTIDRLAAYRPMLPLIDRVVEFIATNDIGNLPLQKIHIIGDELMAIPAQETGKAAADAKLEVHNTYADIQVCLGHPETFGWRSRAACQQPLGEFDADRDILFYADEPSAYVTLQQNEFVLFMPGDAHAPLIANTEVRKLIFKVKVG